MGPLDGALSFKQTPRSSLYLQSVSQSVLTKYLSCSIYNCSNYRRGALRVLHRYVYLALKLRWLFHLSEDRACSAIHLPAGAFAKTKNATNILRPAIDVSFE